MRVTKTLARLGRKVRPALIGGIALIAAFAAGVGWMWYERNHTICTGEACQPPVPQVR